jgi:tRNA(Arg) A34 adenosine deaminase TadA
LERLKGIKRLYFVCSREEFGRLEGGNRLVSETDARGVKWWFADDAD